MFRTQLNYPVVLLIFCAAVAGCGPSGGDVSRGQISSQIPSSGAAPVVLAVTDTPPTNVSILSAEVTLTGATLNPGNVPLFSGSTTLELTRLQTDIAYLGTTMVNAGNYTSITLTFSNPMLTFENDTGATVPGAACNGIICTIAPVSMNLSTTIALTPTVTLSTGNGYGLLADVNLNDLLSPTLGADFSGVTVSQFTPAGTGAPAVGAEDVVGQVTSIDTTHGTFSFQNVSEAFSLVVDNTATFLNFPSGTCTTPAIACLSDGQILSVDISFRSDGTAVARNIQFEDADSSDTEVEGIVTGFNTGSQTINIVTLTESATISGLVIGNPATVHYTVSTPFDLDFVHADNMPVDTTGFLFGAPADLFVGQQVQARRNPGSAGNSINADRVRLRSSRLTGIIQSLPAPFINLGGLSPNFPSLFISRGFTLIRAQTSLPTIFTGNNVVSFTQLTVNSSASARGPLFANAGSPVLIASKMFEH